MQWAGCDVAAFDEEPAVQAVLVEADDLARLDLADELGPDGIERTGLAGDRHSAPASVRPMHSGRIPNGSRAASMWSGNRNSREYEPCRWFSTWPSGSGLFWCVGLASRWTMISVSLVDLKMLPWASYSSRSRAALIRLPLWATATCPREYSASSGWQFSMQDDPVVEYRTWPMAMGFFSFSSVSDPLRKTRMTVPMPL